LTINPATGAITGLIGAAGTYNISISARNAAGASNTVKFTLTSLLPVFSEGIYTGLIDRHASLNGGFGGFATLTVSKTGVVTGTIKLGAIPLRIAGNMLVDATGGGKLTITIPRKNLTPILLNLTLDPGRDFGYAEGTIADSATPADTAAVRIWCNRWSSINLSTAYAGDFTSEIRLPDDQVGNQSVPQGSGFLKLTIGTTGNVAWNGKTADGAPVIGSAKLWPTGEFPLFNMLYANTGSMIGLAAIAQSGECYGRIDWVKGGTQPTSVRTYRTGFGPLAMVLQGGRWVAPASGRIVLGLTDKADNARLDFSQGGVESTAQFADLDQVLRITRTNTTLLNTTPLVNPTGAKLSLVASKGTFKGTFKLNDSSVFRPVTFEGVLLNGENIGRGFFLLPKLPLGTPANSDILSGKVLLSPTP
jgi:hypothetical protein